MAYQEYWELYETKYDGLPVNIRVNEGIENYVCHPRYMYQITISVTLNDADAQGLPYEEESRLLDELERVLRDRLENQKISIFAAVVTSDGVRRYILYTFIPDFCRKVAAEIDRVWVYHAISHEQKEDRYWETIEALIM